MRRRTARPRLARLSTTVATLVVLGGLAGCGGSEDPAGTPPADDTAAEPSAAASEEPEDDREPAEILVESVDATLDNDRATIDSQATLQVDDQGFSLFSEGSVDYTDVVADLRYGVAQSGVRTEITVLADGTDAWVGVEGEQAPTLPDDATWVQGDAARLENATIFQPGGLLGAVLALRAAEEVEEFDTESHDGVETRVFGTTVTYADALAAAGEDAAAFRTALSLTGPAQQSDLDIEVAVGPDDVVRTFDLSIDSDAAVSGGYDIDLTDVGRDLPPPEAPPIDQVATGPDAEAIFQQLLDPTGGN